MSELLRRTIGETITVESVLAGGLWKTAVDPNQLENALLNFAVNARDAMPGGGRLTIETANTPYLDECLCGSQRHRRVVGPVYSYRRQRYRQWHEPRRDRARIRAVLHHEADWFRYRPGLSMVYGFVKQSGGHIKIYSEADEGTAIKLYLPRRMDENQVEPWIRPSSPPNAKTALTSGRIRFAGRG